MNRVLTPCILILSLLFLAPVARPAAAQSIISGMISNEDVQKDERLAKKITLAYDRISLYELAARVTKESGISLLINPEDIFASVPLCISVHDMPVNELLNDISSLLSYGKIEFRWTKLIYTAGSKYRLDTQSFKDVQNATMEQGRKRFRDQLALFEKMALATPEERSKMRKEMAKSFIDSSENGAQSYLNDSAYNTAWWGSMKFLSQNVTDSQKEEMFKGTPVNFSFDSLPAEQQQRLLTVLPLPHITDEHGAAVLVTPKQMIFQYLENAFDLGKRFLVPKIVLTRIAIHDSNSQGVSLPIIGLHSRALKEQIQSDWLFPGEKISSPRDEIKLKKYDEKSIANFVTILPLEWNLLAVSECSQTSFLAVLPDASLERELKSRFRIPTKKIRDIRKELEVNPMIDMITKWRGETLLLNYPEWFAGDDALYPPSLTEAARKERTKLGYIAFPRIVQNAPLLNPYQKKRIIRDFPEFAPYKEILAIGQIYANNSGIYSDAGIAMTPQIFNFLGVELSNSMEGLSEAHSASIRVRDLKKQTEFYGEVYVTNLELRVDGGEWKRIATYGRPRQRTSLERQELEKRLDIMPGLPR